MIAVVYGTPPEGPVNCGPFSVYINRVPNLGASARGPEASSARGWPRLAEHRILYEP